MPLYEALPEHFLSPDSSCCAAMTVLAEALSRSLSNASATFGSPLCTLCMITGKKEVVWLQALGVAAVEAKLKGEVVPDEFCILKVAAPSSQARQENACGGAGMVQALPCLHADACARCALDHINSTCMLHILNKKILHEMAVIDLHTA
jgi:hypothetical protein